MTRKCSGTDFENAIQAYVAGESAQVLAARFHTSEQRLSDELKRRGLFRDRATRYAMVGQKTGAFQRAANPMPEAEIVARYRAGESENAIAKNLGVSRQVIKARLRAAGINRRSNTEANRLLAEQTPIEEHRRRIAIAQEAGRGRKQTLGHRCNIAASREANRSNVSNGEMLLAEWLQERGIDPVPQKAVGPYNVDLGAAPVAVEVFGASWHAGKPIHTKRTRYLLDQGWHLVFIWTHSRRSPLRPAVADYIVSFLDKVRRDPSAVRQYRVVRGDGQELARGRSDSDQITLVVPGYQGCNGSTRYTHPRR